MIAETKKVNTPQADVEISDGMFDYLSGSEVFCWPYRVVTKALLQTQRNSVAYIEAHRLLIDELRTIIRKEQNLVFELSEAAHAAASRVGARADDSALTERSGVNEVFDRAMIGIRNLGEAWIAAQVRSLDTMRIHNASTRPKSEKHNGPEAEAA